MINLIILASSINSITKYDSCNTIIRTKKGILVLHQQQQIFTDSFCVMVLASFIRLVRTATQSSFEYLNLSVWFPS